MSIRPSVPAFTVDPPGFSVKFPPLLNAASIASFSDTVILAAKGSGGSLITAAKAKLSPVLPA